MPLRIGQEVQTLPRRMRDFSDDLADLRRRIDEARVYLRIEELLLSRPQLETEASRPDLWDNPSHERQYLRKLIQCHQLW